MQQPGVLPIQTVALVLVFDLLLPVTDRMGLTFSGGAKLKITKQNAAALIALTLLAAALVVAYYVWVYVPKA